jgi:hypothetical protein
MVREMVSACTTAMATLAHASMLSRQAAAALEDTALVLCSGMPLLYL